MIAYGLVAVGRKPGGVGVFADRLANGLSDRGHDVVVWSYDPAPVGARYAVYRLPAAWFAQSWLGSRLTLGYLANLFHVLADYGDREVLLAHGDSVLLPLLKRPVVRVMHGSGLGEAVSARSPARMAMQLGVYAQEVFTALTQRCIAGSLNTTRHLPFISTVIPYGVDTERYHPDGVAKANRPMVLFVGTLGGRKRGDLLMRWFDRTVRPAVPEAELHAVVERMGPAVAGVVYHVGLTEAELIGLYRRAWVYASPSTYEGFGLPYLEALACGTAVLATPNPGSREVLGDGNYGVLASDGLFPSELVRMLIDPALRAELAANGLRRAADWSFARTLDRYEAVLYSEIK